MSKLWKCSVVHPDKSSLIQTSGFKEHKLTPSSCCWHVTAMWKAVLNPDLPKSNHFWRIFKVEECKTWEIHDVFASGSTGTIITCSGPVWEPYWLPVSTSPVGRLVSGPSRVCLRWGCPGGPYGLAVGGRGLPLEVGEVSHNPVCKSKTCSSEEAEIFCVHLVDRTSNKKQ